MLLALPFACPALVLGALGREGGLVLLAPFGFDFFALRALLLGQEARDRDENLGAARLVADTRDDLLPHSGLPVGDDGGKAARIREKHPREGDPARRAGFGIGKREPVMVALVLEAVRCDGEARQRLGDEGAQEVDVFLADFLRLLHGDDAVAEHAYGAHRGEDLIRRGLPPRGPCARAPPA